MDSGYFPYVFCFLKLFILNNIFIFGFIRTIVGFKLYIVISFFYVMLRYRNDSSIGKKEESLGSHTNCGYDVTNYIGYVYCNVCSPYLN